VPRIVDRSERQQSLAQAALAVFAEKGYHGATMQAVAERAGVSKGSVYDYFPSKQDLLLGTAEMLLAAVGEQSLSVLEQTRGTLAERVRQSVESLLTGVEEWTDVCRSMLQVWGELGPDNEEPLHALMAEMYKRSIDRVQAVFDAAVAAGEIEPFPTRAAAQSILAALDGMILQAIIIGDEFRAGIATGVFARWCSAIVPGGAAEPIRGDVR